MNKLLTVQLISTQIASIHMFDSFMGHTRHKRSLAPELTDVRFTTRICIASKELKEISDSCVCRNETMQCKPDRKEQIKRCSRTHHEKKYEIHSSCSLLTATCMRYGPILVALMSDVAVC